jgi:hypothetical protein
MRKILLMQLTVLLILCSKPSTAQEKDTTYWKRDFKIGLSLNQAAFSDNWNAGGLNSVGFNTYLNLIANYKKGKHSWDNEIDFLYGSIRTENQGLRKTNDRLFLDTKYGYAISPKWDVMGSANFLSQFANGYRYENDDQGIERDTLISSFLTPGYLTFAFGFEYKPAPYFKLRLSPFAPRFTFAVNEDVLVNVPNRYGVDPGKNVRTEYAAAQILADFNKDIVENVNLKMRYIMYANYQRFNFEEIDHRLDLTLSAKVWKYIDVNFNLIMIYDYDQDSSIQFSEALGFGVVYTKKNYKEEE